MAQFKAAIIGCGGRGRSHARGYSKSDDVDIVACADPMEENAKRLAEEYGVGKTYADHKEMLAAEKPDIVSVTVWPHMHLDFIRDAVEAGAKAIHAEKPMAPTWEECRETFRLATENNVVTTFCHQRRFGARFVKARDLVNEGVIGDILRYEGYCPNMYDWGTHWFDMFFWYNNDEPAESVLAQVHSEPKPRSVFGVDLEGQGVSVVSFKNGRKGLLITGIGGGGCDNRIIGTDGVIEVIAHQDPPLRYTSSKTNGWVHPVLSGIMADRDDTTCSVLDLIDCLKSGEEPRLSVRKALQATELIFATYESARSRKRVDLPLGPGGNAFHAMVEEGVYA
ncbi:MAG: Gfo/Idh/MocA family oxidoreductase [Candidatus Poribacteria bacterium]